MQSRSYTYSKKTSKTNGVDYVVSTVQGKADAKALLAQNGFFIECECNYAKRQKNRDEYWVNPKISVVDEEWDLILNNQYEHELIYIHIPAKTFAMNKGMQNGFYARKDKPVYIDLNIIVDTLCDRRSGYDFSAYVVKRLKYDDIENVINI